MPTPWSQVWMGESTFSMYISVMVWYRSLMSFFEEGFILADVDVGGSAVIIMDFCLNTRGRWGVRS